jgi:multiple sugar transport system ATP-binding protein
MALVALDQVTKRFESETAAVDGVSVEVADGEFLVLVGPSGCGKSTLLRMIAGLEETTTGSITIGDRVVTDLPPRNRNVAMVFQNYALYPHMSVADNMGFSLKLAKVPKAELTRRVGHAAEMLGISDLLERKPRQLSGGQRQRVAMGRAIVREPDAFLMDEPLSNLDAKLRVEMRAYISRLHQELRTTTLYVTHDQSEAMTMGDRVALMRAGRLEQLDTPEALYARPRNLFVAGFVGSPGMNTFSSRIEADNGSLYATLGELRLRLPAATVAERPAIQAYAGREITLGIRPEDVDDAAFVPFSEGRQLIDARVSLAQSMGAEVIAHFELPEGAPRAEVTSALSDEEADLATRNTLSGLGSLVGRLNSRTGAAAGDTVSLSVDLERLHFFDPETDDAIYG